MGNLTEEYGQELPFGCSCDGNDGIFYFCTARNCHALSLKLYADGKPAGVFPFPEEDRRGDVFCMGLWLPADGTEYTYTYLADGVEFADPYARRIRWREKWGKRLKAAGTSAAEPVPRALLPQSAEQGREQRQENKRRQPAGTVLQLKDLKRPETACHAMTQNKCKGQQPAEAALQPKGLTQSETAGETEAKKRRQSCSPLPLRYEDSFVYRLHVRSFTKDASSGVAAEKRGTFDGVIEKLDVLQELGVTSLELLPVYEFDEILPGQFGGTPGRTHATEAKKVPARPQINLWGFTPRAMRFTVKQAYGGADGYFRLLEALHTRSMELIADLYFDGTEPLRYVLDVLRAWAFEYRADGLHLIGPVPIGEILKDPYLRNVKLWYEVFPDGENGRQEASYFMEAPQRTADCVQEGLAAVQRGQRQAGKQSDENRQAAPARLALYRSEFQNTLRRFLKGDGGMLQAVQAQLCGTADSENAAGAWNGQQQSGARREEPPVSLHYMANTDGFTLMDLLSYNQKHNEANGEQNRDGTEQNFSWNCGEEGNSRKKKVAELRERLYKNAVLMTLLSAGTPLLLAGDEFGHSKKGNNNSWCQDNAAEWLDWTLLKKQAVLWAFVRDTAKLRREHPVLRRTEPPRFTDWLRKGLPDVSLHGTEAWRLDSSAEGRQLGILYCGAYVKRPDGSDDDSFYIGYNMHWEPHTFALPKLPGGARWYLLADTAAQDGPAVFMKQQAAGSPAAVQKACGGRACTGTDKSGARIAGDSKETVLRPASDKPSESGFQERLLADQTQIVIGRRGAVVLIGK